MQKAPEDPRRANSRGLLSWGVEAVVGRARQRFTFKARVAQEPMPQADLAAVERILAKLIARAYIADHPELFGLDGDPKGITSDSGSPSTARAEAASPTASEGDLGQSENRRDGIASQGQDQ
jgi:hypothetical protein